MLGCVRSLLLISSTQSFVIIVRRFSNRKKGAAFSANTLCQLLIRIYEDCGLEGATSHSGRRSFITNLAAKGVGVRVLAELAAHASISTTQRYIDVNDEQMRRAVELA